MTSEIIYTNDNSLEKQIRYKEIIPYIILPGERYKKGLWYYNSYFNIVFKVLSVTYNKGILDSVFVRTDDDNQNLFSTDLAPGDFIIKRDKEKIYKKSIINSQVSYTGAEIIYWFFMNNIKSFNKKYNGFWKFVDRYSKHRVNDYDKYFLVADKDKRGNYIRCRAIKDDTVTEEELDKVNKQIKEESKYMKKQKQKDYHRIKRYHESSKTFNDVNNVPRE